MKSLRNTNVEIDSSTINTRTEEKVNSQCLNSNVNDILKHCEEDYETAIKAVSINIKLSIKTLF